MTKKIKPLVRSAYTVTFVTTFFILVAGLVNSILLARWLGVTGRGELAAVTLWPTLLTYLGALGLPYATLYFASENRGAVNEIYTSVLILTLLLSIIVIVVGYVLMPVALAAQSDLILELSRISLLTVPFGMLLSHHGNILRAHLRMKAYNGLTLVIPLGSVVCAIVLIAGERLSVTNLVLLNLCLYGLAGLCSLLFLVHQRIVTRLKLDLDVLRNLCRYGLNVYVGTLFASASLRLDQVLLASIVSPRELGLYVVAVKVAGIASTLSSVVVTVAVPQIARLDDSYERRNKLINVFRNFWGVSIVIKALFAITLPLVLPLMYGEEFGAALPVAGILVLASLFLDASQVLNGGAQALNAPWIGSKAEIVAALATISLLLILIPSTGILGAALTSLFAYFVAMLVTVSGLRRQFGIHLLELISPGSRARAVLVWFRKAVVTVYS